MNSRRLGFTIVEVIVVIIVIGVLVAVASVGYGNWRGEVAEDTLKNDLSGIAAAMESERSHGSVYPTTIPSKFTASDKVSMTVLSDGKSYCAQASSDATSKTFYITKEKSVSEGVCQTSYSLIEAGNSHACGVSYGRAYCWGNNSQGQLGNGTTANSSIPVAVNRSLMSAPVTSMSAGASLTCAVAGGKVYCWGINANGSLAGATANASVSTPLEMPLPASGSYSEVSVGQYFACAVAGGKVYCWGANSVGQIGNGTTAASSLPVAVSTTTMPGKVNTVSAGTSHACAISGGQVFCWGQNLYLQLGSSGTSYVPKPIDGPYAGARIGNTVVTAGGSHSCSIATSSHKAFCWGRNNAGQLGMGWIEDVNATPGEVNAFSLPSGSSYIAADMDHTCAESRGKAYCWGNATASGSNKTGQLAVPTPVSTTLMTGAVKGMTAGQQYTCALADSQVYCWGVGGSGQLGNGATAQQGEPVLVSQPASL